MRAFMPPKTVAPRTVVFCLIAASLLAPLVSVRAQGGTMINGNVTSMVFDHAGKYLYVADFQYTTSMQTVVKPYNLATGQFEASYVVGSSNFWQPFGFDIAPDDSFLLVSGGAANGQVVIYKLDL